MKLFQELLEAASDTALKAKAKESGHSITVLRQVYKRGLAAWQSIHAKGVSQHAWAMGRVNSFIDGGGAAKADKDLLEGVEEEHAALYKRWKQLVNMSAAQVQAFKDSQTKKGRKDADDYPGLKPSEAKASGISSGVESAGWIIKMKQTPVKDWTPAMWRWAGKQVSFISRMKGGKGPLKDVKGQPTRKLLSLKIWGHDPS